LAGGTEANAALYGAAIDLPSHFERYLNDSRSILKSPLTTRNADQPFAALFAQ
jgi:hypothetical protein